jgi:hypothetical protein
MSVLSSFSELPMYNFGVQIMGNMDDRDAAYLEQNIQVALASGEIDLEDAIGIRGLRDIDQAEQLLIVRRKKRMKAKQEMNLQNIQAQQQANAQNQQMAMQTDAQKMQMEAELEMQKFQMESKIKAQLMELEHMYNKEIQAMKAQIVAQQTAMGQRSKASLDIMKEDRKDSRVEKQAIEQSKLIAQRKDQRPPLSDTPDSIADLIDNQ